MEKKKQTVLASLLVAAGIFGTMQVAKVFVDSLKGSERDKLIESFEMTPKVPKALYIASVTAQGPAKA